jgi:UDP:flavonoid glycosyltransferase YjiC (YdhE family)
MENKKIFIFPIPAMGHLNTILTLSKKLIKENNVMITIYGTEQIKTKIEETGCKFMKIEKLEIDVAQTSLQTSTNRIDVMKSTINMMFDSIEASSLIIADYIEKEKPDIILYDHNSGYAKWAFKIAKTRSPTLSTKLILYHPNYVFQKNVFPNTAEQQILLHMNFCEKFKFIFIGLKVGMRIRSLKNKFGIDDSEFEKDIMFTDVSVINIAFLFPGLQPRSELFHENVKFVGACIDDGPHLEDLRNVQDDSIREFLNNFQPRNPTSIKSTENFLIYVSLGSMFTDNFDFYLKVIEAYKKFVAEVKSENIFAIINVGNVCFNEFKNGNNHNIPSSIKLVPFAPQLEILKRASVFLTHCGMNSTSESIWFGVPMICMPVSLDQPLIASRVVKDLGLGILLNSKDFKLEDLANSFYKIYSDNSFQIKSFEYSRISQKHNGIENTCEVIRKLLAPVFSK